MDLQAVATRVQRQFGDTDQVQILEADIIRWANDGQMDITRKTECLTASDDFNATAEDQSYAVPDDFLYTKRLTHEGRLLKRTTAEAIDDMYPSRDLYDFEGQILTGRPIFYWIEGTEIQVFPAPDRTVTNAFVLDYIKTPTELTTLADPLEVPVEMHEDLVRYCLAQAYKLDENFSAYDREIAEYEERLAFSMHQQKTGYADNYPSVRMVAGDDW